MKGKSFITIAIIVVVCIIGWNVINDDSSSSSGGIFSSGLEKSLAETLPEDLTTCYCIDNSGEKVLNTLEVKKLTIDRQTTNDNLKTADCTIELEGNDLKMTAYVTLDCIKYDDGSWQVSSWSELAEPKLAPKYQPDESDFIWNIQMYEGFNSLSKTNEHIDLENGEIVYFFSVLDTYDYLMFSGEGVSCSAVFQNTGMEYYDKEVYYWNFTNTNNVEPVWTVLGTWHMEAEDGSDMPRLAEITVNTLNSENAGSSTYSYQTVKWVGGALTRHPEYTGQYETLSGGATCTVSGNNPQDAKCVITGYNSELVISASEITGTVNGKTAKTIYKK